MSAPLRFDTPTRARQRYRPAFPLDALREHPDNPNRANMELLNGSLAAHGFIGAIIAQEVAHGNYHHVLAGNHRLRSLRAAGATHAPVIFVDLDDRQARQFLLADNKAGQAATSDEARLSAVLEDLFSDDALEGALWTEAEMDALNARLGHNETFANLDAGADAGAAQPVVEVSMTLKVPRERVTPELEVALKELAMQHGGRYSVKGKRGGSHREHES